LSIEIIEEQNRQKVIHSQFNSQYSETALAVTARTFLTNIANKGTAIHILKTLAGHRSISTTAGWLYSCPCLLKDAVELV
jgi:site-specific recombinase XerD